MTEIAAERAALEALRRAQEENVVLRKVYRCAAALLNAPYLEEHRRSLRAAVAEAHEYLTRRYT